MCYPADLFHANWTQLGRFFIPCDLLQLWGVGRDFCFLVSNGHHARKTQEPSKAPSSCIYFCCFRTRHKKTDFLVWFLVTHFGLLGVYLKFPLWGNQLIIWSDHIKWTTGVKTPLINHSFQLGTENWWKQLYPEAQVLIHFLEFLETIISGKPIFKKSCKKKQN